MPLDKSADLVSSSRFDLTTIVVHDILFHSPRDVASFLSQQRASRFLECDAKSARQFYEKYPNQVSDDELEFLVQARQLLALGKSVMENVGIRFWLSSGTCLGMKGLKSNLCQMYAISMRQSSCLLVKSL